MEQVVILARSFAKASKEPWEILEKAGLAVEKKHNPEPENEELVAELIGNASAVLVGVDRVGEVVFSRCPNLKVVSKHGVGVDNIDLEAARKHGVVVTNTPGANSESVADMTFALILAFFRHLPLLIERVKNKEWGSPVLGEELAEKTIGIVGMGRIGRGVAKRALGFGMKVIFYDPLVEDGGEGCSKVTLEELFEKADVISLHAPLTDETRGMINSELLSRMKKSAVFVNTARGELVDEKALYNILKEGKIKGAALDVLSTEPPFASPLFGLPNVIVTPHVAAHTREANIKMGTIAALNIVKVLAGEEPLFRVV
ncbi:MAG: D-3-phosphoglycerate dehydrogenase / 2-oxoglutarate reductase [Candidatus Atribacteria bacterium]|uniref:Phosphoglycerate dehydrogenase n=1 Tax=Thermatribacter velox TaxID=3039681 RepID=A0ABZ2YEQ1_9BACT|nr:D-3-phosphoglycerate dehydrogenase / 2-oxoglutarate reductase [Candidatus Atribacteria bacterium]MDI3530533.1 D-3-phosphoglycerate dehydrogenase / 2-oxoglutarate reductase [Candidatus Atribacteria bacterium]